MKNSRVADVTANLTNFFAFKRKMEIHEKRLNEVQPTLRTAREATSRSSNQIKKQPLAEFNRIFTIDMENKALLKKLTDKSPKPRNEKPYRLHRNNRRNIYDEYNKRVQNEGLLKRLKEVRSSYQAQRYASERKAAQGYINNIAKFGYKQYTPNKTLILPQYIRPRTENAKHNAQNSSQVRQGGQNPKEDHQEATKQSQPETILKLEKRKLFFVGVEAHATYIVWSTKLTVQIDLPTQESTLLEMPAHIFFEQFHQNIQYVHSSIQANPQTGEFFILMPS